MYRFILLFLLVLPSFSLATPSQRIGQPLEIRDVYLPEEQITVKPRRDRQPPLMVRILEVKPAKDGARYDFEVQGLEAGKYNLADFLEVSSEIKLPEIPLEIVSGLPPGLIHPNKNASASLPQVGGYRDRMIGLGVIWVIGLLAILFWKKRKPQADQVDEAVQIPLADRLKPLVQAASTGSLTSDERARMERLIMGYWRERRHDLHQLSPADALVKLRHDPDSAPLILALERWLHARNPNLQSDEIEQLLRPYRQVN